ncbi:bleomycin resistance protein [Parashewanella curva]|uniref:Bleomycin resistance protein n=1 Tax=Parashewanella curva TaxID=2338552 RepID=A0A3L8PYP3_9GAMM|nr:VOC family protein [Parashewanella curva]RLV60405.1 bleomycin resistance protein [Parashewanella curva]
MIQFEGFSHINIVVNDLEQALAFYQTVFGAIPQQSFPHFKNIGFSRSAGFIEQPEKVDVTITFLEIPNTGVYLELMEYHQPVGRQEVTFKATNDVGNVGHIALKVSNIEAAFEFVKAQKDVTLISQDINYQPYKIDTITPDDFYFFDKEQEANLEAKQEVCDVVSNIKYFYFIDPYGVQWELEQGHLDIGS